MRIEQLTFTRFLAAISIVIFHYGREIPLFNNQYVSFIFEQANVGVSYFFILSGFVMIIAYENKSKIEFGKYIKKRFARIYPVYFLALFAVLAYLIIKQTPIDLKALFLNLFMLQSWFPEYPLSLNGPGWSLSVEMFFYISFPLLFNTFYKKYSLKILLPTVLSFFIITQIVFHTILNSSFNQTLFDNANFFLYFPIMHFSEFLVGNIAGLIFIKGIRKKNYDLSIIGLIVLLVVLLKFNIGINFHNGMLAVVFIPLIFLISSNNGIITTVFSRKAFVFLGEISYGIYILQSPVHKWVDAVMHYLKINNVTLIFFTTLIVLIIASAISYKFIEAPLRNKINRIQIN